MNFIDLFLYNPFNIKIYKFSLHISVPKKKKSKMNSDFCCHIYKDTKKYWARFVCLFVCFLLAVPVECRSFQARDPRDQTHARAVIRTTEVTIADP